MRELDSGFSHLKTTSQHGSSPQGPGWTFCQNMFETTTYRSAFSHVDMLSLSLSHVQRNLINLLPGQRKGMTRRSKGSSMAKVLQPRQYSHPLNTSFVGNNPETTPTFPLNKLRDPLINEIWITFGGRHFWGFRGAIGTVFSKKTLKEKNNPEDSCAGSLISLTFL